MRALICRDYKDPLQLTISDIPDLKAGPGEIFVKVQAAGLGWVDALLAQGRYQIRLALPFVMGSEMAGTVIAVGDGVDPSIIGSRIAGLSTSGAVSEGAVLRREMAVILPDTIDDVTAVTCLTNYCTALYGLEDIGRLCVGETILILGAGGALVMAACDVARSLGARIIAAASTEEKRAAASVQGAQILVDYGQPDWRTKLEEKIGKSAVDVVFDPVGGSASNTAFRLLRPGGRHLVAGFASGDIPSLPLNLPLLKRSALIGVDWGGALRGDLGLLANVFRRVIAGLLEKRLSPTRVVAVGLPEAASALASVASRRWQGKLVVQMSKGLRE